MCIPLTPQPNDNMFCRSTEALSASPVRDTAFTSARSLSAIQEGQLYNHSSHSNDGMIQHPTLQHSPQGHAGNQSNFMGQEYPNNTMCSSNNHPGAFNNNSQDAFNSNEDNNNGMFQCNQSLNHPLMNNNLSPQSLQSFHPNQNHGFHNSQPNQDFHNSQSNQGFHNSQSNQGFHNAPSHQGFPQDQLPSGRYSPELGVSDNPHYFSANQMLYEAHIAKMQRHDQL